MNCQDVSQLLVAYLDHEVFPSERNVIATHLASCATCQQELASISATRERLDRSLKALAAQIAPSPKVWGRLQARLMRDMHHPSSQLFFWLKRSVQITSSKQSRSRGNTIVKSKIIFAILATLLVVTMVMALVPSIRSQAVELLTGAPPSIVLSGPGSCQTVTGGAVGSGKFIWPTIQHSISRKDYDPVFHPAIDIAADQDSPIVASDAGVIAYAGWNDWGYGNVIIIDHRNGWESLYAQLDVIKVMCGESVKQGQLIGLAGHTGKVSFAHLHFQLWNTSLQFVNPHLYLPSP